MSEIDNILSEKEEAKKSDFENLLDKVRDKLDGKQFAGLCPACLGTGVTVYKKGNYWGLECMEQAEDDEYTIQMKVCNHGKVDDDNLGF